MGRPAAPLLGPAASHLQTMDSQPAALILAGGQSQRMGRDKALLQLPQTGQLLLQHVYEVAQCCSSTVYVLTPWPERYAALLPQTAVWLHESTPGAGPLVALSLGWSLILADCQQHSPPEWLLVLACDMPALDPRLLQQWQRTLTGVDASAIAALPRRADRWEPLCGFYHRRCVPNLNKAISLNIRSFQRWLAQEQVATLIVNSHDKSYDMLKNCNTPVDWQQFLEDDQSRNP